MSVMLEFSNVIIRRDSIENKYPGGWEEWKKNHKFWYDDHLYRTGSMGDDEHIYEELNSYGMVGIQEDPQGRKVWVDYCNITTGPEVELLYGECDWVEIDADNWTAKMTGVPDSEQRYTSEKERKWRLRLHPTNQILALNNGRIETFNVNVFERNDDKKILSSHSGQIIIVDENYEILEHHRLMYGDELKFQDGEFIKEGQELTSFDPYIEKIITEINGLVSYDNLIEGQNLKTVHCDATGITSREILDGKQSELLKPLIKILSMDGKVKVRSDGSPAIYNLPVGCILQFNEKEEVQPGDILGRVPLIK